MMPTGMPQPLPAMLTADEIVTTTQRVICRSQSVRKSILQTVSLSSACFGNVIKPLIDDENRSQCDVGVITMFRYASPDEASRKASVNAAKALDEDWSNFTASTEFYTLIRAVKDKDEPLHPESARYLDELLSDFTRCGHGVLDHAQIKSYLGTRNAMDLLKAEYNKNIRDEDNGLWFSLEELEGVLESDLDSFVQRDNKVFVHNRKSESQIVMERAKRPSTRKKMYTSMTHKLPQNADLLKRIVVLRDTNARLLGYKSHAAFRLEKRLLKTPEAVEDLLQSLETVMFPLGRQEMQGLMARKRVYIIANPEIEQDHPGIMTPWDTAFYTRLAQQDLQIDQTKLSEYFPLPLTMKAMLDIFSSCLQLRFEPLPVASIADHIWHEDVEVWSVWDERESHRGEFIGYIYMDLLWRPNKHQGNQNCNLQCGYVKDDGTRVFPATILMCSFPRSSGSRCHLLKHKEMVTLFHELGHGIHDLFSRTLYVRFHGHRGSADFNEAPSVMLENWCWLKDQNKQMSCHYTHIDPEYLSRWQDEHPGESPPSREIPDAILDRLVKSRDLNRGLWFLRQIAFARFDLTIHNPSSHEECIDLDQAKLYNDLQEKYLLVENPDPETRGHGHADFGHLCAGYDAGYYSYLCASVFAADLFHTKFARNPRDKIAWERYRRAILEPGNSRDGLVMLEEFLGRKPDAKYLLGNAVNGY
ncbi:hypothetical protein ANO11243_081720 [Dothideomycetidae sp. 11243]|nr:hypothetical protein ANO11243_081720 [fungal sp. No.11243]